MKETRFKGGVRGGRSRCAGKNKDKKPIKLGGGWGPNQWKRVVVAIFPYMFTILSYLLYCLFRLDMLRVG